MKPFATLAAAAIAVPLLATSAHAGKPASAPAITNPDKAARVSILRTPDSLVPIGTSVKVDVTYSCKNTHRTTHYLSGQVTQADTAPHVFGYRNSYTGTVKATCTGKAVTQPLTFLRTPEWLFYTHTTLHPGSASFIFNVEARGTFGNGAGWYDIVGPGATVTKTINIPHVYP